MPPIPQEAGPFIICASSKFCRKCQSKRILSDKEYSYSDCLSPLVL